MDLTRRTFVKTSSLAALAAAYGPIWLDVRAATRGPRKGDPLLVTIFLRGGADGLHLVPPIGDATYVRARGQLALRETLPFTKSFALHPAFAPLAPVVARGELAVVHNAGLPHPTRSHFEAQDLMESADLAGPHVSGGWLARALEGRANRSSFETLALASELPLTLRGSGAFAIDGASAFGLPGVRPALRRDLERIYGADAQGDPVRASGARALRALAEYERAVAPSRARSRRAGRRGAGPELRPAVSQLVAMDRAGLPVRAVYLESSGWDTHQNQGGEQGQMALRIRDLAEAMADLDETFGKSRDLLVVVMTEFGRTVAANGSRGSDHGHGSVMFVAGPRVAGGVHGEWTGLERKALHEGRDQPVTSDYRGVLFETLQAHLGERPPARAFPGFEPIRLGLMR